MANQPIQTPKAVLLQQAALPQAALANTPLAGLGVGISSILAQVTQALPDIGGAPPGVTGARLAPPLRVATVFKSIEAALPAGVPSLAQVAAAFENQVGVGGPGAKAVGEVKTTPPARPRTWTIG